MTQQATIIKFPEPEWKPLHDHELLYFKDRFVDNTLWELLVKYWGITVKHKSYGYSYAWSTLECERQPMYPHYKVKDIKEYIKEVMK